MNQTAMFNSQLENDIPLGYSFRPTPSEVLQYLSMKLGGSILPTGRILDLDVYQFDPDKLPYDKFEIAEARRGCFFVPAISRKPRRDTPTGYWKIDEEKIPVCSRGSKIMGFKDKLSFYCHDTATDWKMTEFRCNLDGMNNVEKEYTVCKVRYKLKVEETRDWQQLDESEEEDSDDEMI